MGKDTIEDLHLLPSLELEQTLLKQDLVEKYIREHSLTPSTSSRASISLTPFPLEQPPIASTASDEPGTSYSEEVTPKHLRVWIWFYWLTLKCLKVKFQN